MEEKTDQIGYVLEIYAPGSRAEVLRSFESPTPFMAVREGDAIDPSAWSQGWSPIKVLRVAEVWHALSERDEQVQHKVMVYTNEEMAFEGPASEGPTELER